jgi:hypothetical protein
LEGYGLVKKVQGVGASTIATVKYDEVFGGLLHSNIIFQDLTLAVFGQDWECEDLESTQRKGKRRRSPTTIPVTPLPEQKNRHTQPQLEKKEPPADKLVRHLREGYWGTKAKGWHRKELNMIDPNRKQKNAAEKTWFLHEVAPLEQFLSDPRHNNNHALKYKQSQKFKKRQSNWNPASIWYLVQQAWGCSNSYLFDLRKAQKEFPRKGAAKTKKAANLLLIVPLPHEQERSATKSVIDNLELAERVFTTVYLYAVNACRRDAKDNLEYVDRKSYRIDLQRLPLGLKV